MPSLPNGTINTIDKRGYQQIKDPTHPLQRKGWVPYHRWIAYNAVNGEEQHCAFCNWGPMPWKGGYRQAVNIDHINEIKGDDRPDNLTFTCYWCNLLKSYWPLAYHEHMEAIDTYADTHPDDRPYPMTILTDAWGIGYADINHNINLMTTPGHECDNCGHHHTHRRCPQCGWRNR